MELLRRVRTTPEWQLIPVLLLTADSRSEMMTEAANLGTTEYVLKRFIPECVMRFIPQFTEVRRASRTVAWMRAEGTNDYIIKPNCVNELTSELERVHGDVRCS